jgi:Tfp pilus assembly protein PilF
MNKASFRWAFLALLANSLTGCASPMCLFAKKPQSLEEYKAEHFTKQNQVAGSRTAPETGQVEVDELLHKGHAAFQQGNLPEAQSHYFAVVQRKPTHPVANHRLGVIADRQQDYQSAQRYYFAALQDSPHDPNLLNDIGYSFLLQSRYGEAEQYLQAALRQNGTQTNAINNLGLLYAKQGQADQALAMFRRTNSEAEAQARLARLMPSSAEAATLPAAMLAQNPWATQNATNPAPSSNGGQGFGNEFAGSPTGPSSPNGYLPNNSMGDRPQPNSAVPNNAPLLAQGGSNSLSPLINDPNLPEANRNMLEQAERAGRKALADRQAHDFSERQRREFAARQLRDEEFGRSNGMNPNSPPQPTDPNRMNLPPYGTPNTALNPSAPIVVEPQPLSPNPNLNVNPNNTAGWVPPSNGSSPPNGYVDLIPSTIPNASTNLLPNATRGQMPPTNAGSPLDTMPDWPPTDAMPMNTPNNSAAAPPPNVVLSGAFDDPARAASRMGMSAGPGNMFPITPGPSSAPANSTNSTNGPPATNRPSNSAPPNGVAPTTPPNWPANSIQPNSIQQGFEPATGEPPAGSFGPGNFSTSAKTPTARPSGNAPHPNTIGTSSPQYRSSTPLTPIPVQPVNATQRGNARDRVGGYQWDLGPTSGTPSPQTSSTTSPSGVSAAAGDGSFLEYDREIQRQNAETKLIRQQLDAQRQTLGSENDSTFRRR